MVIAQPINLNVSCKLYPYILQWIRSPLEPSLPKRIGNTHPHNYYNLKGKDIYIYIPWLVIWVSLVCDVDWWLSGRVLALHSVVAGLISSGGDHGIHCWWDLVRSKRLSSVSVCRTQVFTRFSGHGNSIHNIIPRLKNENIHKLFTLIYSPMWIDHMPIELCSVLHMVK